jgi:hypothetical protein
MWRHAVAVIRVGSMSTSHMGEGIAHGGRLEEARRQFPGAPARHQRFPARPNLGQVALLHVAVAADALGQAGDLQRQGVVAGAGRLSMAVAAGTQILIDLLPRL